MFNKINRFFLSLIFIISPMFLFAQHEDSLTIDEKINQTLKPATDWTKCGPKIFKLLNNKQKELFGFTSIPPKFNLKTQKKIIKTLRKPSKLNSNYFKSIQF